MNNKPDLDEQKLLFATHHTSELEDQFISFLDASLISPIHDASINMILEDILSSFDQLIYYRIDFYENY